MRLWRRFYLGFGHYTLVREFSSTSSLPIFAFSYTRVCLKVKNEQVSADSESEALLNSYIQWLLLISGISLNSYNTVYNNHARLPGHNET